MEDKSRFKKLTVPLDVLVDILNIVIETELKNEVTGVNVNRSYIEIKIEYQNGLGYHQRAIENIESILDDYNHYRFEESETDWRNN